MEDATISHVQAEPTRSSRCRGMLPRSQPSRFRSRRCRQREGFEKVRQEQQPGRRGRERVGNQPSGSSTVPRIIRRINWIVGGTWKLNTAKTGKRNGGEGGRLHVAIAKREIHRCANIRAHSYKYTVHTTDTRT